MKLQRWQAWKVNEALGPSLRYLGRLRNRMVKVGFVGNDPLLELVNQCFDKVQELSMKFHYLSCKSGVGLPNE